jgi:hypothetical protein
MLFKQNEFYAAFEFSQRLDGFSIKRYDKYPTNMITVSRTKQIIQETGKPNPSGSH